MRPFPRTAVVLLHALPLSSAMWDVPAAALRARGHRVLTPDQRGFGAAALGARPPSLDTVADDLARLLDEHDIEDAVLAGCSMGGYVAMAFARRHRERLRGLALLAARAAADESETVAERGRFADAMAVDALRDHLVARTTPSLLGATTRRVRPDLLSAVLSTARRARPEAVAWAQRAIAARADSAELLRDLAVPSVVVSGAEDELVTPEEAATTAAMLRGGRFVSLPATGHLAPVEAPESVTDVLSTLLGEVA